MVPLDTLKGRYRPVEVRFYLLEEVVDSGPSLQITETFSTYALDNYFFIHETKL